MALFTRHVSLQRSIVQVTQYRIMQMSTSRTLHCRGQAPAASLAARALTVCSTAARGLPSLALSVASHGAYDSSARSLPAAPRAAAAEPARRDVRTHASEAATSQPSTSGVRPPSTFGHGITYTSYEGNSFAVKFNTTGVRVLVDPWLQGDLVFAEQTWLYKGAFWLGCFCIRACHSE